MIEHHGQQPEALTRPRPARPAASALPYLRPGATCWPIDLEHCTTPAPSSPRVRLARSRGRRPGPTASDRAPQPATRHSDHATASPIGCQCTASPSTGRHLPADSHRALPDAGAAADLGQLKHLACIGLALVLQSSATRRQGVHERGTKCPKVSQPKRPVSQSLGTAQTQQWQGL